MGHLQNGTDIHSSKPISTTASWSHTGLLKSIGIKTNNVPSDIHIHTVISRLKFFLLILSFKATDMNTHKHNYI